MNIDWIPTGAARPIHAKERGNRGIFPSNKVFGGIVEYESCLERDFFLVCNHAPDVTKFQHQPISIFYQDEEGKKRKYSPDVYVEFDNGAKGLFEIKYEVEVLENGDKYAERWEKAKKWGKKRGMVFSVLTERVIRTPRWFNIWFTLGSSKCSNIDLHISKLSPLLSEKGARYDQLCYLLSEAEGIEINKASQILCYAIYHGLVFLDSFSTKQISNGTIIRKKRRKDSLPFKTLWNELGLANQSKNYGKDRSTDQRCMDSEINSLSTISFIIPAKYEQTVKKRKYVVKLWLNQPKVKRTREWRVNFCKKWNKSEKTIYNWVNAYRKDGIAGLIPNYQRSGRQPTLDRGIMEQMEQARQQYLKPLVTLRKAYYVLSKLCNANNALIPPEASFRTYIYKNTTAAEFAKKRGRKYYKSSFTPSLASFQGAFAPMQIVQMDNTCFDVFPVDSDHREELSTPYMTAAMDCYSRMLTGFTVSFFPSSSHTVLEVLVQSILPKDDYVNAYHSEQGWPIQGFPVLLLVDNGMDYRSQALREFCIKYDIIIEYAPIRTPRYKAFIEQWFNILHNALVKENVFGFRPLLKQRLENPDLKPETEAVLTLQEIDNWLYKWVLDEYHFINPYKDHVPAPYLRWQDYQAGNTKVLLPLPREPPFNQKEIDMLYLSMLERSERTLSYEGVVWHHLKYNNKKLTNLYNHIGKQKVEIMLNPRDIRCIWVIDPRTSVPLQVGLGSGWAQAIAKLHGDKPINASAWKKDLRSIKRRLKSRISPFLYQQEMSRLKRGTILRNAKISTKTVRKENEKVRETERNSISSKIQQVSSPPPIIENPKVLEIPRPKSIIIPPRSTNPFAGITKKKAEEMMKRKKEAR